jgi:hypothetical protein
MKDRILEDAQMSLLAKVRQARAMSEEERVLAGPRLFAGVCERMKEGLRDDNPDADEAEIHDLLLQRLAKIRRLEKRHHVMS